MWGFGITYFQDTVKDRQMENLFSKSIINVSMPLSVQIPPGTHHNISLPLPPVCNSSRCFLLYSCGSHNMCTKTLSAFKQ